MSTGPTPVVEHAIMEATRKTLADRGYAGLTLSAVEGNCDPPEHEGVTCCRLREHYDDREDLLIGFVTYERDRFEERLLEAPPDPVYRLRWLLDILVGLHWMDDDGLVSAFVEVSGRTACNARLRQAITDLEATHYDALVETIQRGIETGAFEPVDPEYVAAMLLAAGRYAVRLELLGKDTDRLRDAVDAFILTPLRA